MILIVIVQAIRNEMDNCMLTVRVDSPVSLQGADRADSAKCRGFILFQRFQTSPRARLWRTPSSCRQHVLAKLDEAGKRLLAMLQRAASLALARGPDTQFG